MPEPEVDSGDTSNLRQHTGLCLDDKLAKYRSAASRITVTLEGAEGSDLDQRTDTSPIFGRRSFPAGSSLKQALAVNRMACRRSLRDRNRGGPIAGPFRLPVTEVKKFR